jgi:uncharacterized repeat protein (TIGR02543 family)
MSGYSGSKTSAPTAVVIAAPSTPVADDFDIDNLYQTEGHVTPVKITPKEGKSNGTQTVYYAGINGTTYTKSTTVPQTAGTYTVTFNVAAADGWKASSVEFYGGTLTINAASLDAQTPVIISQPKGSTVTVNATHSLSVGASVSDGGTLSYQWYSNTSASNSDGTSLGTEARSASYSPPTGTTGTYYYFVEVTNTIPDNGGGGNKTASVRSNAVEICVSILGEIVINLTNMNEWQLTAQTAQADSNVNKVFTVTGWYRTYQWYLDGTQVGTSSSYTFNKPDGVYELIVVATNYSGESRSGRCWITVGMPLALTANVWANSSINDVNDEDWYSFPVSSGTTYRIWWNDRNQGNSTKGGNVVVGARYANSNDWIFGGTATTVDHGWDTAQSFTATQTGLVYIRVIPFNYSSSNVGSYGIVYSNTTSTRPAIYTVTFNVNGGSGTAPAAETVSAGFSIVLPGGSGLSRDGYVFGGWNTLANGTGSNFNIGASYIPTSNITLYARWYAIYTVTFNSNGGSGTTPTAQTGSAGSGITLPDGSGLSRDGYTFVGWNTNSSGTGTNYAAGFSYTPTSNITLYARWSVTATQLTANVWANGSLGSATSEVLYSFPVSFGTTYRIWWNDSNQGNGTKTGDVVVGVRYAGSSNWIIGGTDNTVDRGWTTAQSFSATQTGMVEIRVMPYSRSSSYTGTFGIVYSTGTTRPGL